MVLPLTTSLCFDSPSVILQRMKIINHKSKSWFISFIVISDYEIPLRERTPSRPCLATKSWPRNSVGSSVQPHVVSGRHVFEGGLFLYFYKELIKTKYGTTSFEDNFHLPLISVVRDVDDWSWLYTWISEPLRWREKVNMQESKYVLPLMWTSKIADRKPQVVLLMFLSFVFFSRGWLRTSVRGIILKSVVIKVNFQVFFVLSITNDLRSRKNFIYFSFKVRIFKIF